MEETVIKFDDIKISKQIFHQHKRPVSIKNVDNDKILVSNNVPFDKMDLNILLATKTLRKLSLYLYPY